MRRLFGKFLIDHGLVREELVLEALICQIKSTPAIAEVVYEHNLIPKIELYQILMMQQLLGKDFKSCAIELGSWNRGIAEAVAAESRKSRKPLGEIIISLGGLTIESLNAALDRYVSEHTVDLARPSETPASPSSAEKPRAVTAAVKYTSLDPTMIFEFLNAYDMSFAQTIGKLNEDQGFEEKSIPAVLGILVSAGAEFAGIRAAGNFARANRVVEISDGVMAVLDSSSSWNEGKNAAILLEFLRCAGFIMAALAEGVRAHGGEPSLEADPSLQAMYDKFVRLQGQIQEIGAKA